MQAPYGGSTVGVLLGSCRHDDMKKARPPKQWPGHLASRVCAAFERPGYSTSRSSLALHNRTRISLTIQLFPAVSSLLSPAHRRPGRARR